jgi:hypothetical protein
MLRLTRLFDSLGPNMSLGYRKRLISLLGLALLVSIQVSSQEHKRSIRSVVSALRGAKLDEVAIEVPPDVAQNLTTLKRALRSLIVEAVEAPANSALTPDALSIMVTRRLEDQDVPVGDTFGAYGAINSIRFERPKEYPGWLIAETSLSMPYSDDVSLYVFELRNGRWKQVMIVEANGYRWISEAQGSMEHKVLRSSTGTPYLITSEVSASAASVWQRLRLRILRPGTRSEYPRVLARKALGYCLDEPYYFSIRENGFGLIYLGGVLDPNLVGYRGVHYLDATINNDDVAMRETATDPSNLLERWITEPWSKASRRVSSSRELKGWHRRFQSEKWNCPPGDPMPYSRNNELFASIGCGREDHDTPEAYVDLMPTVGGFLISNISRERLDAEASGHSVYFGGSAEVIAPVVESTVRPKLPNNLTASAKLRMTVTVDEKGTVESAGILDWPTDKIGVAVPALQAVRQWKFRPGLLDGKPVSTSTEVEVVFEP